MGERSELSQEQAERLEARARDPEFRARLEADPAAAAAEELGRELTEAELEQVSGGFRHFGPPPGSDQQPV